MMLRTAQGPAPMITLKATPEECIGLGHKGVTAKHLVRCSIFIGFSSSYGCRFGSHPARPKADEELPQR